MNFEILKHRVIDWAKDRGITKHDNAPKQLLKTMEELGEVSRALLKGDTNGLIDGIGDVMVTLIIFAHQNGLDVTSCLDMAYKEIKDRTGTTKDGIFIKD